MKVCRSIPELRTALAEPRENGQTIGFVPTMGYLHEGHASLLRQAKVNDDFVVLSIFVNPLQFGPNEDLERYPRDEERDLALATSCGTDIVFLPSVESMYPRKPRTSVIVAGLTDRLCGASRPGHFDGVGTVVSKLFHLVAPTRAYFGMKDAQQIAVVAQMAEDLSFDVEIVPCETVREPDGLALSSRNVYLTAEQRQNAVVLSRSLGLAEGLRGEPGMTAGKLLAEVQAMIESASGAGIDYVELLLYPSLAPVSPDAVLSGLNERFIVAMAVKFGSTRLIDNRLYEPLGGDTSCSEQ